MAAASAPDHGGTRITLHPVEGVELQADDERCDISLALWDIELVLDTLGAIADHTGVSVAGRHIETRLSDTVPSTFEAALSAEGWEVM